MQRDALSTIDLARFYLREPEAFAYPKMPLEHLEQLLAALGEGPDHLAGEQIVGLIAHKEGESGLWWFLGMLNPVHFLVSQSIESQRWDWAHGAVLTDRRVIVRDQAQVARVPYTEIAGVEASGSAAAFAGWTFLDLKLQDGSIRVLYAPNRAMVYRYLSSVLVQRATPESLRPLTRGALPETVDEATLDTEDLRAEALLTALRARDGKDRRELARRVVLWSRTTTGGRGTHNGMWLSALRPKTMLDLCSAAFGRPEADANSPGIWYFERDPEYGKSLGLTSLLLLSGRLAVSLPKGKLRLLMEEGDGFSRYQLEESLLGQWQPLSEANHLLMYDLNERILRLESRELLRRCVYGDETLDDPYAEADAALANALRAAAPSADPAWYNVGRVHVRLSRYLPQFHPGQRSPPPHLPRPVANVPGAFRAVATAHLASGLIQLTGMPLLSCCGMTVFWWFPFELLLQAAGVSNGTSSDIAVAGSLGNIGFFVVQGVLEVIAGALFLAMPGRGMVAIQLWSVLGILSVCLMGFAPAAAGLMTLIALRTAAARLYLEDQRELGRA